MLFKGAATAVITPFTKEGIDFDVLNFNSIFYEGEFVVCEKVNLLKI